MWPKMYVALVISVLMLAGCAGAATETGPSPSGSPAMGSTVPPGTDERMLPEQVWKALQSMKEQEGTHVVMAEGDAYAIITAGEKPGYLVEVISADKTGGQIEVRYAIHQLSGTTSVGTTITHPYNVYKLEGEAQTTITFRKTEPPQR